MNQPSCRDCDRPPVGRGLCNKHYMKARRKGALPPLQRKPAQQPTGILANVVPTPETRKLVNYAIAHARESSGADAALIWLPKLPTEQRVAFIGLLLQKVSEEVPAMTKLAPAGRVTECRDCGQPLTRENRAGRGLCRASYDYHMRHGTLDQFPHLIRVRQQEAS